MPRNIRKRTRSARFSGLASGSWIDTLDSRTKLVVTMKTQVEVLEVLCVLRDVAVERREDLHEDEEDVDQHRVG